ncbi:MAG: hypothetical protein JO072_12435 [Parafilimonas sp.]|nr:hypothetical protein [Parafilimonas sp.]
MDFFKKLEEINEHTSPQEKKYIHFKSFRNFIHYYNLTKKEKNKITELLEQYIAMIESKDYILSKEESKDAYNKYIRPLGYQYYRKHLNFSIVSSIHFIVLFLIVPNAFVWFIFRNTIISSLVLFFSLCYIINYSTKYFNNKVYGYHF